MMRSFFLVFFSLSIVWGAFFISGPRSSRRDDAYSKAVCPSGYKVARCWVMTGNVPSRSDGAFVDPDNGRICVAVNGNRGSGVIARALCMKNKLVYNPCYRRGPKVQKFINLHARGSAPRVSCPYGYSQRVCNAHSPWTPLLSNKGVDSKGVISRKRSCSVSGCSHKNWCEVTAVCESVQWSSVCPRVRNGARSGRKDDAESRAVCPSGLVVTYCEVRTGNVDHKSDGAFVNPENPHICVAVNGARGSGAIARAECLRNSRVYNRCKRRYVKKFLHLQSVGRSPSVSCPGDYQQILCNAHSPWSGQLSRRGVNQYGIIPNNLRCRLTGCDGYCRVTAVCRIKDSCT